MQYALLAYGSERADAGPVEAPIANVLARPSVTGWARLHGDGSATTVRNGEGRTLLTDGPFIETKEVLGGYSILDVDSIDEAVDISKSWPGVDRGWITIELRPVMEMG